MASSRHVHPQAHPHSSAAHILHRNRKRHHPRPGAAGGTSVEGDDEGEGGMGMSSSRDASEEDNDDTSNYSDSASSFRHSVGSGQVSQSNEPTSSLESNNLPTSARDRVLVNSNPAGKKTSSSGGVGGGNVGNQVGSGAVNPSFVAADKTPSSSSPPKHGSGFQDFVSSSGPSLNKDRRPSSSRDPVASTLQHASAALASSTSSSSSSEAQPSSITRPMVRRNLTNSSSAGSGDESVVAVPPGTTPRMNAGGLHLDSLPVPSSDFSSSGVTPGVVSTPIAQVQPSATATSNTSLRDQESKTFNNGEDEDTDKEREESGENDDGGSETDGATYDGDVEFAARLPASTLLQAGQTPGTSGGNATNSPSHVSHSSSAPNEAPSRPYSDPTQKERPPSPEPKIEPPTPSEIQKWFQSVLDGTDENGKVRDYKINRPVDEGKNPDRPIRIYADGVYDLFHYAHMLQLRQAKLSFPNVHLIVGVCSSSSCSKNKNTPVLSSSERYNSVKNCRWVDEVLEDAPWVIDQNLIYNLKLDYVAHDEAPYGGGDSQDIYKFVKDQGKFLPTRRTPGVSTSELLGRIVDQYRHHNFDGKLEKLGLGQLSWKDQDEDGKKGNHASKK